MPPTERFVCTTAQIVELTQGGFSDNEILHQVVGLETSAGYSPSLLADDEVRALATPNLVIDEDEEDTFQAMQYSDALRVDGESSQQTVPDQVSEASSIEEDWFIDLLRIVERFAGSCSFTDPDDFTVSVYTWFLDHQKGRICDRPKIVSLGGFPSSWKDELIHPWRHHIDPTDRVLIDLVTPPVPKSDVEEHVAHVILTQGMTDLSSILLSLDFPNPDFPQERSIFVRFAVAVPKHCTRQDLSTAIPLLADIAAERIQWKMPVLESVEQEFRTRHGLGIQIQILPSLALEGAPALADITNLLQTPRSERCLKPELFGSRDQIFDGMPRQTITCSFTDEFLEAVAAHEDATRMDPPADALPDPRTIEAQPAFVQFMWQKAVDIRYISDGSNDPSWRVESWFLNHDTFTRCHNSRITLLPDDFLRGSNLCLAHGRTNWLVEMTFRLLLLNLCPKMRLLVS